MWWCVVQTTGKEVHVYPLEEEHEHILDDGLCNCMPEVKRTIGGQMVLHKKIGNHVEEFHAHWIKG